MFLEYSEHETENQTLGWDYLKRIVVLIFFNQSAEAQLEDPI